VRAFAPGSVSNVACGFDIFGFALDGFGDEITARVSETPGIHIDSISGDDGRLPLLAENNTAGLAAAAALEAAHGHERGLDVVGVSLEIDKKMPLSSGLGSSAASAVAAAVAVDGLLDAQLSKQELLLASLAGERLASGAEHCDNLAPSLYGGFVLVRAIQPRADVVRLPVPEGLTCALVRPHMAINTSEARGLLGTQVSLRNAIKQWGNTAALVAALYSGDFELLRRSLHDYIAEPARAGLVPGFSLAKAAAIEAGALGCSLSGSGPSVFALCATADGASAVVEAMASVFEGRGLQVDRNISPVGAPGARILAAGEHAAGLETAARGLASG
jgi:homoserine kinase